MGIEKRISDLESMLQSSGDDDRITVYQVRLDSVLDPTHRWTYELLIKDGEIPTYYFGAGCSAEHVERMQAEGHVIAIFDRVVGCAMTWALWCMWRDFLDRADASTLRAYRGACRGGDRAIAEVLLSSVHNDLREAVENSEVLADTTVAEIDRLFSRRNPYYQIYRSTWTD